MLTRFLCAGAVDTAEATLPNGARPILLASIEAPEVLIFCLPSMSFNPASPGTCVVNVVLTTASGTWQASIQLTADGWRVLSPAAT